jgi:hypothetical protein
MSEHLFQDELEERDDVVGKDEDAASADEPSEGKPWAKTSSGDADDVTSDEN